MCNCTQSPALFQPPLTMGDFEIQKSAKKKIGYSEGSNKLDNLQFVLIF